MARPDFTQFELPCTDPARREDWHISERYPLAADEERDVRLLAVTGVQMEMGADTTDELEQQAANAAVKAATEDLKLRRRKAAEACYYDCPMAARLLCLDEGLKPINLEHGIWGGYPESKRREIADAIAARKKPMSRAKAARLIVTEDRRVVIAPDDKE